MKGLFIWLVVNSVIRTNESESLWKACYFNRTYIWGPDSSHLMRLRPTVSRIAQFIPAKFITMKVFTKQTTKYPSIDRFPGRINFNRPIPYVSRTKIATFPRNTRSHQCHEGILIGYFLKVWNRYSTRIRPLLFPSWLFKKIWLAFAVALSTVIRLEAQKAIETIHVFRRACENVLG